MRLPALLTFPLSYFFFVSIERPSLFSVKRSENLVSVHWMPSVSSVGRRTGAAKENHIEMSLGADPVGQGALGRSHVAWAQ